MTQTLSKVLLIAGLFLVFVVTLFMAVSALQGIRELIVKFFEAFVFPLGQSFSEICDGLVELFS